MRIFSKQRLKTNVGLFEFIKKENIPIRHVSDKQVRVRFAPSPTGFLHLGGLRTALYNYLFARSQNGVSLLRIEDTDQSRIVENATENLIQDLLWCGIKYDEPPVVQSKRLEIYQNYLNRLIDQGDAYHCFCSKVRLNLLKRELVKEGEVPRYDNKCRNLSKAEVESKLKSGKISCVRFKLSSFKEGYNDMVCGNVNYDVAAYEGDPVIFKDDGFPTYHFANVVDDHLMGITHVLRGIEWQVSTPKHLLLYRAFGWTPPVYGHLPLLLNLDGSKLSKRIGGTEVQYFRKNGFLPRAVVNFISSFGGGLDIDTREKDTNIFTIEELAQRFDIKRVKSSSCMIQLDKLNYFNRLEMEKMLATEEGLATLTKLAKEVLQNHFKSSEYVDLEENYVRTILINLKSRISNLRDLIKKDFLFLWDWKNTWNEDNKSVRDSVKDLASGLGDCKSEWTEENIKLLLNDFIEKNQIQKVPFMKSLRILFTGNKEGPSIVEIMHMLGKDNILNRLSIALKENKEDIINQ